MYNQGDILLIPIPFSDLEIKLPLGCTEDEKEIVMQLHNGTEFMKGAMIWGTDKC